MGKNIGILNAPSGVAVLAGTGMEEEKGLRCVKRDIKAEAVVEKETVCVYLTAEESAVSEIVLTWEGIMKDSGVCLGDHWERGYGDLEWKPACETGVMPWYFMDDNGARVRGYGVKVQPGSVCYWEIKEDNLLLHMDVRCGGDGVLLKGRKLKAAEVVMWEYEGEDAFAAMQDFCKRMSVGVIAPKNPIYGSNNWYYAYGKSSAEEILGDTAYLAKLTQGNDNRPYMVIDDGWQVAHDESYNGGPWNCGNEKFPDMKELAAGMKKYGVRPGIWFRPLFDKFETLPKEWRLERDETVLDISVPEVLEYVKADVRRICEWGYELIKHDFSTYDIWGRWGFETQNGVTTSGWRFKDTSRTTAEIILAFYKEIKEAAGGVVILGCNCIGHIGAGLMEANRTGDDTSGREWERTKKMGINTLAFRMPQHNNFYMADADCVGITNEVPWEKNRQWMDLLAVSGTPFFVSVKPGILNEEQEEELKQAYKKASKNVEVAIPLDWKDTLTPQKWKTFEGEKDYRW